MGKNKNLEMVALTYRAKVVLISLLMQIEKWTKAVVEKQSQTSGDNSSNIQGEMVNIVVKQGLSVEEAIAIANEVFAKNALDLASEARKEIEKRSQEFFEVLVAKINERNGSLNCFRDPDLQYSIFEAGLIYGKSGSKKTEEVLIEILAKRSQESEESLKRLILNESISRVGKLTVGQIYTITEMFVIWHSYKVTKTLPELLAFFENIFSASLDLADRSDLSLDHLKYLGCVDVSGSSSSVIGSFIKPYACFWSKGYSRNEIQRYGAVDDFGDLLVNCINNPQHLQIAAFNESELSKLINSGAFPVASNIQNAAKSMIARNLMSEREVVDKIYSIRPDFERYINAIQNSSMNRYRLSTVGQAIAISHIHSMGVDSYDIDMWIG